jgi:hypothetical protein
MTGSVLRMDGGYLLGGDRTGPLPGGILVPQGGTGKSPASRG